MQVSMELCLYANPRFKFTRAIGCTIKNMTICLLNVRHFVVILKTMQIFRNAERITSKNGFPEICIGFRVTTTRNKML